MPTNPDPLTFGTFYHIYNRGNNHENVFIQERNYNYFMELWWKHTSQIAETCAYCLLKNHFHATVYIKNREDLTGFHQILFDHDARVDYDLSWEWIRGNLLGLLHLLYKP